MVQTFVNEATELVHVEADGEEIICTNEHPFYSPVKGWMEACDLRAGDILVAVNGEYVVVEQVQHEILDAPVKVYNFEVEDFHTYYVGDTNVLVHNLCRKLTKGNFRYNLQKLTHSSGKGAQAHHVLPQKFMIKFQRAGLNINSPVYGSWVNPAQHSQFSYAYNKAWETFFRNNPYANSSKILAYARHLANYYGFEILF